MTMTPLPQTADIDVDGFTLAAVDLYRDIHKGIRAELFEVTSTAGNLDPASHVDRAGLAAHVADVAATLTLHAEHEDRAVDPVLEIHLPDLAATIRADHEVLDAKFAAIADLSSSLVGAPTVDQRRLALLLHLELSEFTSRYLTHQILEERVVMPALEQAIGPEAVLGIHVQIVSSIPPDVMAKSLAFMLPAMNIDDRVELLSGMRMAAPPEAFAGVISLAGSVLSIDEHAALSRRLGV